MIVVEGMDSSGKSTLARYIAERMGSRILRIQESEGPPRSDEEINNRCRRYERYGDSVLFVRHPVISNAIYGKFRSEGNPITQENTDAFYRAKPLLIYCDVGDRRLDDQHVVKDHDTPQHLEMIAQRELQIVASYREWAVRYAHVIYRIGDDMDRIADWAHGH